MSLAICVCCFLLGAYLVGIALYAADEPIRRRLWRYGYDAGRRDAERRATILESYTYRSLGE